MIDVDKLAQVLKDTGYAFYTGKASIANSNLYNLFEHRFPLISANTTAEAIALAGGANLAGKRPVVLIDETSLLSAMNILEVLTIQYNLPFLGIVTFTSDEKILHRHVDDDLLLHKIKTKKLDNENPLEEQIKDASDYIQQTEKSLILTIENSQILEMPVIDAQIHGTKLPLIIRKKKGKKRIQFKEALASVIKASSSETRFITADPMIAKKLEDEQAQYHLNFTNAEANAAAVATSYALLSGKVTIVIDTPATLLNNMHITATIGHYKPKNLLHIILDDQKIASTGNQRSISNSIDFAAHGQAMSYPTSYSIDNKKDLEKAIATWHMKPETTLIHASIEPEEEITPEILKLNNPLEMKEKFLTNKENR